MGKRVQSWEVSDEFWAIVEPHIPVSQHDTTRKYKRKPGGGRKPLPPRRVFEAIVYVLRTGIQWKALPKEVFGSPSSIHAYFRKWEKQGFFLSLWQAGLAEYDEMMGIAWEWQAVDGGALKAPLACEAGGRNPTDRGKKRGSKRHILVDERGVPLSIVGTGANRHDVSRLENVLKGKVVGGPFEPEVADNLCADAGYTGDNARQVIENAGYLPHVRPRGEEIAEKERNPEFKPRRWVVEVSLSWLNRFRKLLVRFEKLHSTHLALTHLAAAIIALRKTGIIYG
ncbi:IS5 family transposase [Desulfohalovibrio reitneri]|uniref:IS5 family transposase n=1 Tax=Desulfohalovibrio reitneri TaxID=1307759 RepID=UPI00110F5A20|nr:IS5 family transposase [Desulfohalovibrio reitneri]